MYSGQLCKKLIIILRREGKLTEQIRVDDNFTINIYIYVF